LTLDETEKEMVLSLQVFGDAKLSEIVRTLQASKTTVYNKLKKLEKLGLVKTTETYTYRAEQFINTYSII
jgi:uncharacterized membrane protein